MYFPLHVDGVVMGCIVPSSASRSFLIAVVPSFLIAVVPSFLDVLDVVGLDFLAQVLQFCCWCC